MKPFQGHELFAQGLRQALYDCVSTTPAQEQALLETNEEVFEWNHVDVWLCEQVADLWRSGAWTWRGGTGAVVVVELVLGLYPITASRLSQLCSRATHGRTSGLQYSSRTAVHCDMLLLAVH